MLVSLIISSKFKINNKPNILSKNVTCLFRSISSQVFITFCDKLIPNDPGFTLGLPVWMLYHEMLQAVAERVSVDQRKLQIYFSAK